MSPPQIKRLWKDNYATSYIKKAIDAVKEIALKETEMARGLNVLDDKNHDQGKKDNEIPSIWWMIADCTDKVMSNDSSRFSKVGWLWGLRSSLVETGT